MANQTTENLSEQLPQSQNVYRWTTTHNNHEGEILTLKQSTAWFSLKITSRNQQLMTTTATMADDHILFVNTNVMKIHKQQRQRVIAVPAPSRSRTMVTANPFSIRRDEPLLLTTTRRDHVRTAYCGYNGILSAQSVYCLAYRTPWGVSLP